MAKFTNKCSIVSIVGHEDDEIVDLAESVKKIQWNLRIKCVTDEDDGVNNASFNIAMRNGAMTLPIFEEVISYDHHHLMTHNHRLQPLSPKPLKSQKL